MPDFLKKILRWTFAPDKTPWCFLALGAVALVIQLHPAWRNLLIYDRRQIAAGEWWRLWTGHFIHFGWPHFITDGGLFLILGRLIERDHPLASRSALVLMPLVISGAIFLFDPGLARYGGLSALNLGLLIYYALLGWQHHRFDWFWPGVLAIYVGEVVLEATQGHGHGGGMIRFDDPTIHVATSAHLAGGLYGLTLWALSYRSIPQRDRKPGSEQARAGERHD